MNAIFRAGKQRNCFNADKITVNGRLCKNPETVLKENSKISARGYGKLEYRGEEHTTKKGKDRHKHMALCLKDIKEE